MGGRLDSTLADFHAHSLRGSPSYRAAAQRLLVRSGFGRLAPPATRRAFELALVVRHAQHCLDHDRDCRPLAAVHRFARSRVDLVAPADAEEARMLANDEA